MKRRKTEGSDGVIIEMVEAAGELGVDKITKLANRIYRMRQVPETMKESEFYCDTEEGGSSGM